MEFHTDYYLGNAIVIYCIEIVFSNVSLNEDWYRQRQPMSQFMMVPRKVGEYHEGFNEIAKDLVAAIKALRTPDNDLLSNVPSLLFKWSFECM